MRSEPIWEFLVGHGVFGVFCMDTDRIGSCPSTPPLNHRTIRNPRTCWLDTDRVSMQCPRKTNQETTSWLDSVDNTRRVSNHVSVQAGWVCLGPSFKPRVGPGYRGVRLSPRARQSTSLVPSRGCR
jgi:hypothetical protein